MNELDLLKTHWQKDQDYIKFKKEDITQMIHKSSSSIVKWIFIICCLEFLFILTLNIASYTREPHTYKNYEIFLSFVYVPTMLFFIYSFYKYFHKIKNSSNSKELITSILKAKRQTFYFILSSLIFFVISTVCGFIYGDITEAFKKGYYEGRDRPISPNEFDKIGIYLASFMGAIFLFGILYIYYNIIYIRLTKKLTENYEELIAIEQGE